MRIGVLTVSDTCAADPTADRSGPEVRRCVEESDLKDASISTGIVPDEITAIKEWISARLDALDVILTTGGTGFAPRDVTPEATRQLIERPCPGIVVALLRAGLEKTPLAALSRPEAGIAGRCLIVNLAGSPKAVRESMPVLLPLLPHAVALLGDDRREVRAVHNEVAKEA
ncbi:Molybdenum cofactor biosynthesis protein [Aphelenchoides fujianensis]|nr:Molybdenum cofactor biosynthesis protein [Aphelenchoides fujianensis]